jgi:hypothetical protein
MLQTWYFATPRFGGVPAPPGQNITKGENPLYPIIYCSIVAKFPAITSRVFCCLSIDR